MGLDQDKAKPVGLRFCRAAIKKKCAIRRYTQVIEKIRGSADPFAVALKKLHGIKSITSLFASESGHCVEVGRALRFPRPDVLLTSFGDPTL